MDLLYFLKSRLDFIERLYDGAISQFEETKRKIEAQEPPYLDSRDPECVDEPAFLPEWQDADDSIMTIGYWALCMVQSSLKAYLRECVGPLGNVWWNPDQLKAELPNKKGGSEFGRYRLLFLEDLEVDWNQGPVKLADLEQLNLTRDDLTHQVDMFNTNVARAAKHASRYPAGMFVDEPWARVGVERLKVDKEKLLLAIDLVRRFCGWLDEIRTDFPAYLESDVHARLLEKTK
jgi:hypothetical protein